MAKIRVAVNGYGVIGRRVADAVGGFPFRRASDPWEAHLDGILNTIVPEPQIPSHQGPNAKTVIPDPDIVTVAVKAAESVGHLHYWTVDLATKRRRLL